MTATVADKIAKWLADKEITHAFGIVGGGNFAIFDAIARLAKTKIVCVHHEQAAAMASSYFNRTNDRLRSIALVTTGAGSTNAITGVAAAYMDSIPLLVISGNESSKYMGAPTRVWGVQGYDSSGVVGDYGRLCKASARLSTEHLVPWLDTWLKVALTPRQGPVWLDIPKDVQNAVV